MTIYLIHMCATIVTHGDQVEDSRTVRLLLLVMTAMEILPRTYKVLGIDHLT